MRCRCRYLLSQVTAISARGRAFTSCLESSGCWTCGTTSPYVYFIVGLASMLFSTSAYGFAFSTLLIVVAVTIFSLRRAYRSPERQKYRKYSRPRA